MFLLTLITKPYKPGDIVFVFAIFSTVAYPTLRNRCLKTDDGATFLETEKENLGLRPSFL